MESELKDIVEYSDYGFCKRAMRKINTCWKIVFSENYLLIDVTFNENSTEAEIEAYRHQLSPKGCKEIMLAMVKELETVEEYEREIKTLFKKD